jgi:hypothetical protein
MTAMAAIRTATTVTTAGVGSLKTTDGAGLGFDTHGRGHRLETPLAELTRELSTAVGDAYWSFMLRGELEEELDSALLRAAMADTPILSGVGLIWTS